jgi:cytochrome oxidase Cu insertion factor (SCO1/SenC/PrrC family)
MNMTVNPRTSSRIQLVLLVTMAVVSLAGASLLFQAARGGALWGTTNNGTFVTPPVTVADLNLRDEPGVAWTTTGGTWWLWVVPQGPCESSCQHALHQLRQLHILLNRDAGRVRRALVRGTPAPSADLELAELYPQLAFLSADVAGLAEGIYVIDPLGNLVLHYPMQDAGKPVLDDLKRLLKVSQIG